MEITLAKKKQKNNVEANERTNEKTTRLHFSVKRFAVVHLLLGNARNIKAKHNSRSRRVFL